MDLREHAGALRHPWETVRSRFFRRLVARWSPATSSVVDVGSGDGWFASQLLADLPRGATITCWDAHYGDDDLAADVPAGIRRTATAPTEPAPLVVALDVLEHVEHDHDFVRDHLAPLVATGGTLIVSVPAHQRLFTSHDRALGHYRRHSSRSLRDLLSPHFDLQAEGSLFVSLVAPRALAALLERVRPPATPQLQSSWSRGRLVTAIVTGVLSVDAALCHAMTRWPVRLPGLSVWAVATPRRRAGDDQP